MSTTRARSARHEARLERLESRISRSYAEHPERHTRRHRLRLAITQSLLMLALLVFWGVFQIFDLWADVTHGWRVAIPYLALWVVVVLFFWLTHRLTITLDGVNRLPVDQLDELQRDVRQRASETALNVVVWSASLVFLAALVLDWSTANDSLKFNLLVVAVYALCAIALSTSTLLISLWLPDQALDDAEDLDEDSSDTTRQPSH